LKGDESCILPKNEFTSTLTTGSARRLALFALLALSLCAPLSAKADVVTDWNANHGGDGDRIAPQSGPRRLYRARGRLRRRQLHRQPLQRLCRQPPVTLPASPEAAAVAAAHGVLVKLFPASKTALDNQYAASLAQIPDGDSKT
jgi:hypothetical protein